MQPLLLLDVDGVLHDRHAMDEVRRATDDARRVAAELGVTVIVSHGRKLAVPQQMRGLVSTLVSRCETWWCSTWRGRANDELARHLGIPPLPYLDDGTNGVGLAWKVRMVDEFLERPMARDRHVYWIEDFHDVYPELRSPVTYVDTGDRDVLTADHLPVELKPDVP